MGAAGALAKAYGTKILLSSAFAGEADDRDRLVGDIRNRTGKSFDMQWKRFAAIETTPASGQYRLYEVTYKLVIVNPMPGSTPRETEVVRVNLTPEQTYSREEAFDVIRSRDQAIKQRAAVSGTQPG